VPRALIAPALSLDWFDAPLLKAATATAAADGAPPPLPAPKRDLIADMLDLAPSGARRREGGREESWELG
jgi:hypothetical protein